MEVAGRREGEEPDQKDRGNERECEACIGEGVTTIAGGLCIECEEFMCKKCFKDHLKAKQCRNHVFDNTFLTTVPLKKNFEVEKCKRHAGELIKFYCRKHEIVGCGECMIPDHFGCSPENIKDLCKEFRCSQEFAGLERSVKDVECSAEANSTKIKEHKNANAEMYKKALNGIKQFRKDINNYLDTAETTIIQDAKDLLDANDTRLIKLEKDYMLQSSRITEMSGQLDPDLYSECGLFIQTVTLKSIMKDIQQAVSMLQQETNIKEFNFVPEKQLKMLTKSLHNFGKICCSTPPSTISTEEKRKLPKNTSNILSEGITRLSSNVDREGRGHSSDTKLVVGSRVRDNRDAFPMCDYEKHKQSPGTVTKLGKDGTVAVQWDATGINQNVRIENIKIIKF